VSKRNREFEAPEVISAFTAPSSVSSPGPPGTRERRHPRAGRRAAADHAEPPAGGRSINLVFAMLGVIIVGMVVVTLNPASSSTTRSAITARA